MYSNVCYCYASQRHVGCFLQCKVVWLSDALHGGSCVVSSITLLDLVMLHNEPLWPLVFECSHECPFEYITALPPHALISWMICSLSLSGMPNLQLPVGMLQIQDTTAG